MHIRQDLVFTLFVLFGQVEKVAQSSKYLHSSVKWRTAALFQAIGVFTKGAWNKSLALRW